MHRRYRRVADGPVSSLRTLLASASTLAASATCRCNRQGLINTRLIASQTGGHSWGATIAERSQQAAQIVGLDWLDEMFVETRFERGAAIIVVAVAG
jgi:hypothetical protein